MRPHVLGHMTSVRFVKLPHTTRKTRALGRKRQRKMWIRDHYPSAYVGVFLVAS